MQDLKVKQSCCFPIWICFLSLPRWLRHSLILLSLTQGPPGSRRQREHHIICFFPWARYLSRFRRSLEQSVMIGVILSANIFENQDGIWSGHGALVGSRVCSCLSTLFSEMDNVWGYHVWYYILSRYEMTEIFEDPCKLSVQRFVSNYHDDPVVDHCQDG